MKERIKAIYANLNPDILEGIQDHITDILGLDLSVYEIIDACFYKYPAADLTEVAASLEAADSIGALEDIYDLIEVLATEAGLL